MRPAAHGITAKSYSNLKSLFAAALELVGVIDSLSRGTARRHPEWRPLLEAAPKLRSRSTSCSPRRSGRKTLAR
jgi:hypothetical protein